MQRGIEFLKSQVSMAVLQHRTFLQSLEDHESQARDARFRDLCSRHIPPMREHQRALEGFQRELGGEEGMVRKAVGAALGMAHDLADVASQNDYLKLVGDLLMARQSEDTFRTFRDGGRSLGIQRLAELGETAERHHDVYAKEANRLVQQMFVEFARGAEQSIPREASHPSTAD